MSLAITHCKHCGQKLRRPIVERVPFTIDVLTRIKNGVTAQELGWDEPFYISVCRKHGLAPNVYPPKTQAPPEIGATAPLVPAAPSAPLPPATGGVVFDTPTRLITRGAHSARLSPRLAEVFALVAKGTPTHPANGRGIAERLGIHIRGGVGSQVMAIRAKLLPLNLQITSQVGRMNAGYWLADLSTHEPIKVRVTR